MLILLILYYLPFNPIILSHSRIWIATFGTFFSSFMKCIMTASSTSNMRLLSSEITHWSGASGHTNSLSLSLPHIGGGDIITTLSPRTTIVPKSLESPPSKNSTESSNNKFMCWSKPWRLPLITFPPFNLIRTTLPRLSSRTFTAMSTDNANLPTVKGYCRYILKFHCL